MDSRKISIESKVRQSCGVDEYHFHLKAVNGWRGHIHLLDDSEMDIIRKVHQLLGNVIVERDKDEFRKIRDSLKEIPE